MAPPWCVQLCFGGCEQKKSRLKKVFEEKPRLLPWGRSGEPLGIVLPPILLTITKIRIGRHGRGGPPPSDAREGSARSLRGRPESLPTNHREAIAWPVRERQVRQRGDPHVPLSKHIVASIHQLPKSHLVRCRFGNHGFPNNSQ